LDLIEWQAATNTTRWKEKPIHEDAFAIVVGIISQQTVPLVLLLAAAVATATSSPRFRADFLMHGLFKVLSVDDGANFAGAVGCPIGCHHFDRRLARVQLVGSLVGAISLASGPLRSAEAVEDGRVLAFQVAEEELGVTHIGHTFGDGLALYRTSAGRRRRRR